MSTVVGIAVQGFKSFNRKIQRYTEESQTNIKKALRAGAVKIHADAVSSIARGDKTGALYGAHRASAPGEAPATDTGELVSKTRVVIDDDGMEAKVESLAKHAMPLEFGVKAPSGGWLIAPRPFLGPAYRTNLPQIRINVRNAVRWRRAS